MTADTNNLLRVGTVLHAGVYRIERHLSSGGFGNTYVATNIEFDERVAIKEFFMKGVNQREDDQTSVSVSNRDNTEQFEEQREKFKKEARRLRRPNSPYVVKVHDLFEENGTAYYVMDYVDGESLSERLKRTGMPLDEADVWKILPQVLDGLKAIHNQGIWHLDLKPGNIMVDRQGKVKIIDFGASKQLNAQKGGATTSSVLCRTPGYAPREQEAQQYDKCGPWTDFYALGATLYNLISGRKPPSLIDIEEEGDKVFAFPTRVSTKMRKLIEWLMQPNRMKRPQSVDEVIRGREQPKQKQARPALQKSEEETVYNTKAEAATETKNEPADETLYATTKKANRNATPAKRPAAEDKSSNPKKGGKKWWLIGVGAAVLCAVIALVALTSGNAQQEQEPVDIGDVSASWNSYTNTLTVNDVAYRMIPVEGGTFQMGSNDGGSDEKPVHSVTLSNYSIGETEVTQALWKAVMGSNPSYFKGDNLPVEKVSWNDCQTFITKLNKLTGEKFRLPTEAEWEFAAKGGRQSRGFEYSGNTNIDYVAWYDGNSGSKTHEVATKSPNELGIYDMSGNVYEWCQDWYGGYSSSAQTNPTGPSSGSSRVYRGGSWYSYAAGCRTAFRIYYTPLGAPSDLGLRLAC